MAGRSRTETVSLYAGAFFMFGLAALFMTHTIWPGILILIFLTSVPILLTESGWLGVWIIAQTALWLIGLPLMIVSGIIFPGIFILIGLSVLLVAIAPPEKMEQLNKRNHAEYKAKRKRDMPLPDVDEEDDDYAGWPVEEERRQYRQ